MVSYARGGEKEGFGRMEHVLLQQILARIEDLGFFPDDG